MTGFDAGYAADTAPEDGGPRCVSPLEIREPFAETRGWSVGWIRASTFETCDGEIPAYLSLVTRR